MHLVVGESDIKGGYVEFKYYAEVWPSVCTPLSPSLFTPHQILYSPALSMSLNHVTNPLCIQFWTIQSHPYFKLYNYKIVLIPSHFIG